MDYFKIKVNAILLALSLLVANIAFGVPGSSTLWERAAIGNIPGVQHVTIRGYNGAITTSTETIWPESSDYVILAANQSSPTISSANANDTSAGSGARTVKVTCVDAAWAVTTGTYTMNGQTGVNVTQSCMIVNKIEVVTAGATGFNEGAIYVGTGTITTGKPAVVNGHLNYGNAYMAAYYAVPAGYTLLCRNIEFSSYGVTAGQSIQVRLSVLHGGILTDRYLGGFNQSGTAQLSLPSLLKIGEESSLEFLALSAASTGPIMMSAECLQIENDWLSEGQELL